MLKAFRYKILAVDMLEEDIVKDEEDKKSKEDNIL